MATQLEQPSFFHIEALSKEEFFSISFKNDFIREKLFLLGVAFIIIGVMVFVGMTPRGQKANPVGAAWVGAAILIGIGLALLAVDYYLNR